MSRGVGNIEHEAFVGTELLPLWNVVLQRTIQLIQSDAKLNHDSPALLNVIATAAPVRIHEFNAQNLSNTAWGFAKMNHKAPLLFDVIAQAAQAQINEFSPQSLYETSWAFITMSHEAARSVFDAATARAEPVRIKEFNPQNHPSTSWTFGTLKHEASSLLEAMAQVSTSTGLGRFETHTLSSMLGVETESTAGPSRRGRKTRSNNQ
jgi:hypothetical protein